MGEMNRYAHAHIGSHWKFHYLFKTDSDAYPNIPEICNDLHALTLEDRHDPFEEVLYIGRPFSLHVTSKRLAKVYADTAWAQHTKLALHPRAMGGLGYVLSWLANEKVTKMYE